MSRKTTKTIIGAVLDRSGSMAGQLILEGRNGFNRFVQEQIDATGDAFLYLTIFDDNYDIIHDIINVKDIPELTEDVYFARGMTALLDAVGRTITSLKESINNMSKSNQPDNVIIVILTDGYENASSEFNRKQVRDLVEDMQNNHGWEFIYMGANQNAFDEAKHYGISIINTMNYAATGQSVSDSYSLMSSNVRGIRAGLDSHMPDNADEIDVDGEIKKQKDKIKQHQSSS